MGARLTVLLLVAIVTLWLGCVTEPEREPTGLEGVRTTNLGKVNGSPPLWHPVTGELWIATIEPGKTTLRVGFPSSTAPREEVIIPEPAVVFDISITGELIMRVPKEQIATFDVSNGNLERLAKSSLVSDDAPRYRPGTNEFVYLRSDNGTNLLRYHNPLGPTSQTLYSTADDMFIETWLSANRVLVSIEQAFFVFDVRVPDFGEPWSTIRQAIVAKNPASDVIAFVPGLIGDADFGLLFLADGNGQGRTQLTTSGAAWQLRWDRAGRRLAYVNVLGFNNYELIVRVLPDFK